MSSRLVRIAGELIYAGFSIYWLALASLSLFPFWEFPSYFPMYRVSTFRLNLIPYSAGSFLSCFLVVPPEPLSRLLQPALWAASKGFLGSLASGWLSQWEGPVGDRKVAGKRLGYFSLQLSPPEIIAGLLFSSVGDHGSHGLLQLFSLFLVTVPSPSLWAKGR